MPTVVSTRTLSRGARFDFVEAVVARGEGEPTHTRQFIRHPGAVVVVPILPDGRVALIRSYRASVDRAIYELPAGTREQGEDAATTASRELIEEAGYRADSIVPLGDFLTSPGLSDERMWAFVATGLTEVGQALEDNEDIQVVPVPAREALAMLDDGRLADAKSMLALLLAERRGLLPGAGGGA